MRRSSVVDRLAKAFSVLALTGLAGCAADSASEGRSSYEPPDDTQEHPSEPIQIEESDIIRLEGERLYVLNRERGLSVIDVSWPFAPKLLTRFDALAGGGGELYVRGETVLALAVDSGLPCHALAPAEFKSLPSTALSLIEDASTDPKVNVDRCVPGRLVTSRMVGGRLYVVTSGGSLKPGQGYLYSVDASNPDDLVIVESLPLTGEPEVHVTESRVYIAEQSGASTRIRLVDISSEDGSLLERGAISIPGHTRSRFHLDAPDDESFRIVTRDPTSRMTALFVVNTKNPDKPTLRSSLQNLARGEELFATRFIGDRVYIVTYQPEIVLNTVRLPGSDPLWVVSLENPDRPELLGRLEIPGWSDYIFPRGDQLFAVGRGTDGARVAASLFDVSDPTRPRELRRVEFGADRASTEAATDFRAVAILEGASGGADLAVIPYSNNVGFGSSCVPEHHLQLVEIAEQDLMLRGRLKLEGRVLRGLSVGDALYGITTREVAAIDASDLSRPDVEESVLVGDPERPEACVIAPEAPREVITTVAPRGSDEAAPMGPLACSFSERPSRSSPLGLGALVFAALACARRTSRRTTVRKGAVP